MSKVRITQKFLAEKAGVCQKTVSFFLKGEPGIAKETSHKLERLCKQYKYFPNAAALSIKNNRFKRIAGILSCGESSPHFISYISNAAKELALRGYSLSIEPVQYENDTLELAVRTDFLKTLSVDGAIGISGSAVPGTLEKTLAEMDVPLVWLNRRVENPDIHCLSFDERPAIAQMIEYLINQKKARRISWIGAPFPLEERRKEAHYSLSTRLNSVNEELALRGMRLHSCVCTTVKGSIIEAAFRLLDVTNRPDAVICYNNGFYNSVLEVAHHLGIPENALEIVSFMSEWEISPLRSEYRTSIQLPEGEMARYGARLLCDMIEGGETHWPVPPLTATFHPGTPLRANIITGERQDAPICTDTSP